MYRSIVEVPAEIESMLKEVGRVGGSEVGRETIEVVLEKQYNGEQTFNMLLRNGQRRCVTM